MGRRPNALVSEYFVRGEKLTDQSNRYAHTCRRCGEYFSKGRVDSLCSHLLRRCPGVSQDERNFIFQAIQQQNSEVSRIIRSKQSFTISRTDQDAAPNEDNLPALREQSALDTLAEVSRRHLDYSTQQQNIDVTQQLDDFETQPGPDRAGSIADQLQHAAALSDEESTHIELTRVLYEVPTDENEAPLYQSLPSPAAPQELPASALDEALPLVQTASAANQQLEDAASHPEDPPAQQLSDTCANTSAQIPGTEVDETTDTMSWNPVINPNCHMYDTLIAATSNANFGVLRKGGKVRGRFEDDRRKEVQKIRKQGACMRCRMLKKPCSEGSPCKTCQGVESARLWKGQCLRTRLVDESVLWSTGLFHSKAKIEVPSTVRGLEQSALPGRIEVRLFSGSDVCMTFAATKYHSGLVRYRSNMETHAGRPPEEPSSEIWLLDEGDGMSSKMRLYVDQTVDACIANEEDPFLKATTERAHAMAKSQAAEAETTNASNATRSCYNLQNQLLQHVVELWVETAVLTSRKQSKLQLRYDSQRLSSQLPIILDWSADDTTDARKFQGILEKSEDFILAQLLAVTESRCVNLSKTIINEMERRLVQRQQASRFSTFLCAVILLNCIERMTGTYRAFDPRPTSETTSQEEFNFANFRPGPDNSRPPNWPLDKLPHTLWRQGEHFADLLIMLLRMRALQPKPSVNAEGKLFIIPDLTPFPFTASGKQTKEQLGEEIELAAAWLNPMGLELADLIKSCDGGLPGPGEDVKAWDMKFISRVLLPQEG